MKTALMVISVVAALIGIFTLNKATGGVGALVVACWAAIMARIEQADAQHLKTLAALDRVAKQQSAEYEQNRAVQ